MIWGQLMAYGESLKQNLKKMVKLQTIIKIKLDEISI